MKIKEFVITILFILTVLLVDAFFPIKGVFQRTMVAIIFLVIIPLAYARIILKKPFTLIGIQKGDFKKGIIWSVISLFITVGILFLMMQYTNFLNKYLIPENIINNFWQFLKYEIIFVFIATTINTFFFYGFIALNLSEKIGYWAIFVQFLFLLIMIAISGPSKFFYLPYLVFAPFAGLIAYKSKSIFYPLITQLLVIIILDASVVWMIK